MFKDIVFLHLVYAGIAVFVKYSLGKKSIQGTHAWRLKHMPTSTPKDPKTWKAMNEASIGCFAILAGIVYIMSWAKILGGESLIK
jgi:hypothetical protein